MENPTFTKASAGTKTGKPTFAKASTGRYFKYAIGEIILVVIGILIALSINNWNEDKKLQKKEINLIKELRVGLVQDTVKVMSYLSILNISENAIKKINNAFEKNQQPDSLNIWFGESMFRTGWDGTIAPYETLKSQGISIISNDTLRKKIINLYEAVYPSIISNEKNNFMDDANFKNYCATLFNNIAWAELTEKKGFFKQRKIIPHNIETLKNDNLYKTLLNTRLGEIEFLKYFIIEAYTKQAQMELFKIIDRELNRLEE